jgi:alkanesulfonate monooxygenase SsuD/methylene tetrahydromethanopterin reductase-like flavin-dependent oxidoreductase (luciferase family)
MTLHVGLALPNQHPRTFDQASCLGDQITLVESASDWGWNSVWAGQHFLLEELSMLQPVPYLARLAASTGDMQLGIGISLLALLNPVQAAEDLASLDVITSGRLIAGFGLGYRDVEFNAFGVDKAEGLRRMVANLGVIKDLWAGGDSADLDWCRFQGAQLSVLPIQRPGPAIWLAAHVDKAVIRAARIADAWYISPHVTFDTVKRQISLFRDERAAAGHDGPITIPIAKEIFCAPTTEEAWRLGGPYISGKYKAYEKWGQDQVLPEDISFGADLKLLSQDRFIVGSPEDCLRRLIEVVDSIEPTHIVLRIHWPAMPVVVAMSSLRLLSTEVVPALREHALAKESSRLTG